MPYSGPRRGGKSKYTSVRLTGLFKTKKRGLCVGTMQTETIGKLIEKIKEAKKLDRELTVFLWVNNKKDDDNQPYFIVSIDVARPPQERPKSNPIADDPFGEDPAEDDAPF